MRIAILAGFLVVPLSLLGCGDGSSPLPPTIDSVTPSEGVLEGGTEVVIAGSGFLDGSPGPTAVAFGAEDAVGCAIVDDATLACTTPAGAAGAVDVTVTNLNGSDVLPDGFTYVRPHVLYAADGKTGFDGNLYVVDPATAEAEVIGPVGYSITGLCLAQDGTLFGTESTQSGSQGDARLIQVDTVTGAGTVVGDLFDGAVYHNSVADCSFHGTQMIGWTEAGDDLVNVDTASGAVTVVGNSGVSSSGSGLAVHPDGTIYFAPGRVSGSLYTINGTTGIGFEGPALSGGTYDNINSMAFLDGVLYAIDTQDLGSSGSLQVLVTIDVTTGAMSAIGALPTGIDSLVGSIPIPLP